MIQHQVVIDNIILATKKSYRRAFKFAESIKSNELCILSVFITWYNTSNASPINLIDECKKRRSVIFFAQLKC